MAIVNRDVDPSQQRDLYGQKLTAATGVAQSFLIGLVPYPATAVSGAVYVLAAAGITGTPTIQLVVRRNLAAGLTVFTTAFAASQALTATGGTGPVGISFVSGASALALQQGDVLFANTDGVTDAAVSIVLRKSQDIVKCWGL